LFGSCAFTTTTRGTPQLGDQAAGPRTQPGKPEPGGSLSTTLEIFASLRTASAPTTS